jgi:hypothetical protein
MSSPDSSFQTAPTEVAELDLDSLQPGVCSPIMTPLQELIQKLSEPGCKAGYQFAKANRICKLCGKKAETFRTTLARLEYNLSAICQDCQDKYF